MVVGWFKTFIGEQFKDFNIWLRGCKIFGVKLCRFASLKRSFSGFKDLILLPLFVRFSVLICHFAGLRTSFANLDV